MSPRLRGERIERGEDLADEFAGGGQDQRPRGGDWRRTALVDVSRITSGSRNAYVLPEPVRPRPSTSRPAIESASVAAWMGVGVSTPASREDAGQGCGHAEVE